VQSVSSGHRLRTCSSGKRLLDVDGLMACCHRQMYRAFGGAPGGFGLSVIRVSG
jgi:hypothetical protein